MLLVPRGPVSITQRLSRKAYTFFSAQKTHLGSTIVQYSAMTEASAVQRRSSTDEPPLKKQAIVPEHPERHRPGQHIPSHLKPGKKGRIKRKYTHKIWDMTTPMGVLTLEVEDLFKELNISKERSAIDINRILNSEELLQKYNRIAEDVKILRLTSSGDGLGIVQHPELKDGVQAVVVPFAYPGETVDIRVFRTHPTHCEADLLKVKEASPLRKDELAKCVYFGRCLGCQYQNVEYSQQLEFKKNTIKNAYKHFAKTLVSDGLLPEIGDTIPSPLQYRYRTKLTPHFDMPRGKFDASLLPKPALGFGAKGRPQWRDTEGGDRLIVDVEECIIGTDVLNLGLKNERKVFDRDFRKHPRGATILLREHTRVLETEDNKKELLQLEKGSSDPDSGEVSYIETKNEISGQTLVKTCVTDNKQIVSENINGRIFKFSANEFFQNNNLILPVVTKYVRDSLYQGGDERYLVDAYCGSGLFSITCSEGVREVCGVEVSRDSVAYAEKNAELNGIKNASFLLGKAEKIFDDIKFPHDKTSVICDPPRRGCDEPFLIQLAKFNPAKIIYISCNVHSQARDLEFFLKKTENGRHFKVESVRGFDFFPQTHHVESVAVLSRI